MSKKRLLLLATGGTICLPAHRGGACPGLDGEALTDLLPSGVLGRYEITVRDILQMDSSNIQPEEWQIIARHVFDSRTEYDGIVITHGTDTMAYTASVLSFMLQGIELPVVLTGSQLPIEHPLLRRAGESAPGAGHGRGACPGSLWPSTGRSFWGPGRSRPGPPASTPLRA